MAGNAGFVVLAVLILLAVVGFTVYSMIRFLQRPKPVPQTIDFLLSQSTCARRSQPAA